MASDTARIWKELDQVRTVDSAGKLNAAAVEIFELCNAAYRELDWMKFVIEFLEFYDSELGGALSRIRSSVKLASMRHLMTRLLKIDISTSN